MYTLGEYSDTVRCALSPPVFRDEPLSQPMQTLRPGTQEVNFLESGPADRYINFFGQMQRAKFGASAVHQPAVAGEDKLWAVVACSWNRGLSSLLIFVQPVLYGKVSKESGGLDGRRSRHFNTLAAGYFC